MKGQKPEALLHDALERLQMLGRGSRNYEDLAVVHLQTQLAIGQILLEIQRQLEVFSGTKTH